MTLNLKMNLNLCLAYTNSAVNPILYAFTLRPFRETLKGTVLCLIGNRKRKESKKAQQYSPLPLVNSNNISADDQISPKIREDSQITTMTTMTTDVSQLTPELKRFKIDTL